MNFGTNQMLLTYLNNVLEAAMIFTLRLCTRLKEVVIEVSNNPTAADKGQIIDLIYMI